MTSVFHSRWCKVLHTVETQFKIVAAAEETEGTTCCTSQVLQKLVWLRTGVIKAKIWKFMYFLSRQRYIVVALRFCAAYMDINKINSFKLTSLALNWYLDETSAHFTPCCMKSTERPWLGFLSLVAMNENPLKTTKMAATLTSLKWRSVRSHCKFETSTQTSVMARAHQRSGG